MARQATAPVAEEIHPDQEPIPNADPDPGPAPVDPDPIPVPELVALARDPLDATEREFGDWEPDERGWIVFYEAPGADHTRRYHRVPVALWAAYERRHGF